MNEIPLYVFAPIFFLESLNAKSILFVVNLFVVNFLMERSKKYRIKI